MAEGVAVIGAGAVGLTLAGRLAQHGIEVDLFETQPQARRFGSKAICMQRETLEIWARLGVGDAVAQRGVRWWVGRTYLRGRQLFEVHLPGDDEHFPPFVNINQSEVEDILEDRCRELGVRIHRGHRFTGLTDDAGGVTASFETDAGLATHRSSYLVGADGAHSPVRHALGVEFAGYTFDDRFLICDVRAELPFSNERHFHFDPPWNPGRQVLIHPQPDGIWRIDWQVPPETDADLELSSGRLDARIRQIVGDDAPYELVWFTAYRFSQRLAARFRVGRAFLAGDAAHVMSPFGARGLNSGAADAENLAWKLAWVLRGEAPERLLDSYEAERRPVAEENLRVTDATMRFMAPHGPLRRAWRELVLRLAGRVGWFRARVNSGRLAEPAVYPVAGAGDDGGSLRLGSVAPDVRLSDGTRLRARLGRGWALVVPGVVAEVGPAEPVEIPADTRYGPDRAWLVRPDGHLAASLPLDEVRPAAVERLLARAVGG